MSNSSLVMKWFFVLFVIFLCNLLIAIAASGTSPNNKFKFITDSVQTLDSNIVDFITKDFKKDYLGAKQKHSGKEFLICGVIYSITPGMHDKKNVLFEEDYICISILIPYLKAKRFGRRILCYMKYDKDVKGSLVKGTRIKLKGKLDFDLRTNDVAFRDCEVVND
ncbi:hypothetical protein P0136_03170 [Lentisphaerota bacterium ZTH]|nr:hypothetical protein JYG24_05695 [Lentisphaerota bacterium]WET07003.1 hypothetical protein P0136_03170 [Lentisphaerota bacterium ZTH]